MITVRCPNCQAVVSFPPERAGDSAPCTSCGTLLVLPRSGGEQVAAGAPPAPASQGIQPPSSRLPAGYDDEGYGGGRGWERDDDRDRDYAHGEMARTVGRWRVARSGLMIVFISLIFVLVFTTIMVVASAAMGLDMERNPFGRPQMNPNLQGGEGAIVAVVCGMFIALIAGFVGLCLCIAVPRESGAKGHAIATVVMIVIGVVIALVGGLAIGLQAAQGMAQALQGGAAAPDRVLNAIRMMVILTIIAGLIFYVAAVFFALHLRAIALYFARPALGTHIIVVLILYGLTVVLTILFQIMMLRLPDPTNLGPLVWLQRVAQIVQIGVYIYFLVVLFMVYKAITPQPTMEREYEGQPP
jgi:hypothetical protein